MHLLTPKIQVNDLNKQEASLYKNLSAIAYGTALATKIAEKLIRTTDTFQGLYHSHRDYCGLGLFYENDLFKLTTVYDGYGPESTIISFDSKVEFIEWLALEND